MSEPTKPFPGPLYALSLDARAPERGMYARLVHVIINDVKHVALFASAAQAEQWVKDTLPANSVLRTFAFTTKGDVLTFLRSLARDGHTHICFNPSGGAGTACIVITIPALIERVERMD